MSALVAASPELKRLWIRVLKRVHPDLAVDEQDRLRCERLTQQANDAFARRDEVALRAVLEPKGPLRPAPPDAWEAAAQAQPAPPPPSTYQPPVAPPRPAAVIGRQGFGILWAACAVLCLLLYGIFAALSEKVGRGTSVFLLALLTATVLWAITRNSNWPYGHKARWAAAVASGMFLVGICLLNSHPQANPLIPSARAATADAFERKNSDHRALSPSYSNVHLPLGNMPQNKTIVFPPGAERAKHPATQLDGYIEAAKNKVAQKWNSSEADGSIPAGATVYIQFAIRRRGTHEVPTMETSSGYSSLDASCLRAVDRIRTFDHLPNSYNGDSLIVLYHCTYPGPPTTKVAQDSIVPPAQQPPNDGPVDGVHDVQ